MTFEIEAGGRSRRVEIQRQAAGYRVIVDGREHMVDVAKAGPIYSVLIGRASYEVAVLDGARGDVTVYVNGQPVPVSVAGRGRRRARPGAAGEVAEAGGPQRIVAPMPGRIVKVLVRPGDTVAPRQGLVVVEAMKMENELRSPKAGTVADVRVTEGMSVEAKAVLVVVT